MSNDEIPTNQNNTDGRFLSFTLCDRQYALPLLRVKEVLALSEITPVPQTPPHFKGIMNLRGQVISIIDLRAKLKMGTTQPTTETAVIILDLANANIGIIVDSANEVFAVGTHDLRDPPELGSHIHTEWIQAVTERNKSLVIILDIDQTVGIGDTKIQPHLPSHEKHLPAAS